MKGIIFSFFIGTVLGALLFTILVRTNFISAKNKLKASDEVELPVETSTPPTSPTPSPSSTPTPTLTPTPTPKPTNTPLPTLTAAPTPTLVPQPTVSSEQIHQFIERFAGQYGIDPSVLRHIAVCESGFNPLAVNNTYAGLYQFGPITWKNNRLEMGEETDPNLRFNAEESVQTAAYLLSIGRTSLWPNCYP